MDFIRFEKEGYLMREDNQDRKSTRLNSSHGYISYAVFCLKKKKNSNIRNGNIAESLSRSAQRRRTRQLRYVKSSSLIAFAIAGCISSLLRSDCTTRISLY